MERRRLRIALAAALISVAALALAACGGSGTANASSPSNARSSFAAYAKCLRDHGVKLPSFGGGGGFGGGAPPSNPPSGSPPQNGGGFRPNLSAAQRKAFQAAQSACGALRPQFGGGGNGSGGAPFNG